MRNVIYAINLPPGWLLRPYQIQSPPMMTKYLKHYTHLLRDFDPARLWA